MDGKSGSRLAWREIEEGKKGGVVPPPYARGLSVEGSKVEGRRGGWVQRWRQLDRSFSLAGRGDSWLVSFHRDGPVSWCHARSATTANAYSLLAARSSLRSARRSIGAPSCLMNCMFFVAACIRSIFAALSSPVVSCPIFCGATLTSML